MESWNSIFIHHNKLFVIPRGALIQLIENSIRSKLALKEMKKEGKGTKL